MAKSFIQSSHKKLAAEKLRQLRKAEHQDAMNNSGDLITLIWEDSIYREKHQRGLLPDSSYYHYQRNLYYRFGMHVGGYAEDTNDYEDEEIENNEKQY